jgi:hypothetical protein
VAPGGGFEVGPPAGPVAPVAAALVAAAGGSSRSLPDLVVIVDGRPSTSIGAIVDRCTEAQVRWLRTAWSGGITEIGPLVGADDCACARSFLLDRPVPTGAGRAGEDRFAGAWASLVAVAVLHVIGGIGAGAGAGRITAYDLDEWEDHDVAIPHVPGCRSALHPSRGPIPDRPLAERR